MIWRSRIITFKENIIRQVYLSTRSRDITSEGKLKVAACDSPQQSEKYGHFGGQRFRNRVLALTSRIGNVPVPGGYLGWRLDIG